MIDYTHHAFYGVEDSVEAKQHNSRLRLLILLQKLGLTSHRRFHKYPRFA